jgi:hypothetical protein
MLERLKLQLKKWRNYFNRFLTFSLEDRKLFFEALFFLYVAKTCLVFLSFKHCVKLISFHKTPIKKVDAARLILIKRAIHRASYFAFWKNPCLVQSIAARWMLNRRAIKSQLKLGIRHDAQKNIAAHAWVIVQDIEIVEKGLHYTELSTF